MEINLKELTDEEQIKILKKVLKQKNYTPKI